MQYVKCLVAEAAPRPSDNVVTGACCVGHKSDWSYTHCADGPSRWLTGRGRQHRTAGNWTSSPHGTEQRGDQWNFHFCCWISLGFCLFSSSDRVIIRFLNFCDILRFVDLACHLQASLYLQSSWCYIFFVKFFTFSWAEPGGIGPWSGWLTIVLQCYDIVGWLILVTCKWSNMTYNVLSGTLNPIILMLLTELLSLMPYTIPYC